jgi:hypothetical protein
MGHRLLARSLWPLGMALQTSVVVVAVWSDPDSAPRAILFDYARSIPVQACEFYHFVGRVIANDPFQCVADVTKQVIVNVKRIRTVEPSHVIRV